MFDFCERRVNREVSQLHLSRFKIVIVRDAFIAVRVGVGLIPARDCVYGTELPRRRRSFPWRNP